MSRKDPCTIVIVDDHAIMRAGLEAMLKSEGDYVVVGVAADGKTAIRSASELLPDIILMDLSMSLMSGIDAIVQIKRKHPNIKIVVLTLHSEEQYVFAALKAGANAYVIKNDGRDELLAALSNVSDGKFYLSPSISGTVVERYLSGANNSTQEAAWEVLTSRERQVIKLVAEGKTTKEIAVFLSLSAKTIEKHRANMMRKLNLRTISAVTAYAIRSGLIDQ